MSDARQAVRAASEVDAERHAPARFDAARALLERAAAALESGDYEQARMYALAARAEAIRARGVAVQADTGAGGN